MSENREICGLSIASLVTGIIGFFPVAIVCGHLSLRNIRKNNLSGRGLAIAGTILGYVYLGFFLLALTPLVLFLGVTQIRPSEQPVVIEMTEGEAGNLEIEAEEGDIIDVIKEDR